MPDPAEPVDDDGGLDDGHAVVDAPLPYEGDPAQRPIDLPDAAEAQAVEERHARRDLEALRIDVGLLHDALLDIASLNLDRGALVKRAQDGVDEHARRRQARIDALRQDLEDAAPDFG